ncbi:hypothetical protein POREN0001_1298 [Porphyromonas endodontalis ATCC 35406]|uniref:Uncharacterized protein n=1 Tax=Porphyromonas endodontalis (strain ATCC 35406 / DSM 24491 / JCM 8526 / CCUG 16442 / BCRC 14492 / NCTC 13058 / HG 370) TaxID=553175 RepID=C3J855_POREA|nr:hypothetical protein POREN0001_1298 [Porphyromonas endodontalis ATCC 35406]
MSRENRRYTDSTIGFHPLSLIYCIISIAIYKTFITFGQSLLDKMKPLMSNGELLF